MSRLLYRLSYTALMYGSPHPKVRISPHQSPNTESNRRPSPYHGDALPTELLGRAMKTLHGLRPFTQIRLAGSGRRPRVASPCRVSAPCLRAAAPCGGPGSAEPGREGAGGAPVPGALPALDAWRGRSVRRGAVGPGTGPRVGRPAPGRICGRPCREGGSGVRSLRGLDPETDGPDRVRPGAMAAGARPAAALSRRTPGRGAPGPAMARTRAVREHRDRGVAADSPRQVRPDACP